jgi:hypothetical protein
MPERYVDQLRRITRERGGGGDASTSGGDAGERPPSHRRWRYASLVTVAVVVLLAGAGWLLVQQMVSDAKLQDCVMSGRKNCAPVEVNGAGR